MPVPSGHDLALCGRFHRAIELIGRRWTGAIVFLLLRSRCRYATLRDAIPDITDRMLSERLQELEEEGIVERTVVPATPVRVEYALTKKGRALASAIGGALGRARPADLEGRERFSRPPPGLVARRAQIPMRRILRIGPSGALASLRSMPAKIAHVWSPFGSRSVCVTSH
jgi:DNA-binding HxlR family transcriptional regulator